MVQAGPSCSKQGQANRELPSIFNSVLLPNDTDSCKYFLSYILTLVTLKNFGICCENSFEIRETGTLIKS